MNRIFLFALVAFCSSVAVTATMEEQPSRFDNYKVYRLNVETEQQLNLLREIDNSETATGYEFWQRPNYLGRTADIMVAPHQMGEFVQIMNDAGIEATELVSNVQTLIDNEQPKIRPRAFGWTAYQTLDEIYGWLDEQLAAYPNLLTPFTIGQSFENRTIRGVKLSAKAGNPTIFIETNIHAREWITSATATWFLNELLTSSVEAVRDLATNIDWVIVPVLNVDGFAFSHRVNRLWRKTRQPHAHLCYGTDANRNFGFEWMTIGASNNPCSETFAGPAAWSEPESLLLSDYVTSISSTIKIYLSFHSYGQYLLFPYGHTKEHSHNYDVLMSIGQKTKEAIASKYGTQYSVGPSSTVLYETSGTSVDWAYAQRNINVAYTFEFRDRGTYGFVLPADQIIPNGEEILEGMIALVAESRVQGQL